MSGANPRVLIRSARGHALFVARADGSGQRQITPWSLDAGDHPDWSPNGKLILFRSSGGGLQLMMPPAGIEPAHAV